MEVLYLLLPITLVFVVLVAGAFFWAIFSGQFDDAEKQGRSILLDDDSPQVESSDNKPGLPDGSETPNTEANADNKPPRNTE